MPLTLGSCSRRDRPGTPGSSSTARAGVLSARRAGMDAAPFNHVLYPRNGAGRGYFLDVHRERLEGAPLPTLEDPTDPVDARAHPLRAADAVDRPPRGSLLRADRSLHVPALSVRAQARVRHARAHDLTSCPPARCSRRSSRVRSACAARATRASTTPRRRGSPCAGCAAGSARGSGTSTASALSSSSTCPTTSRASRSTCPASASASSRPC